MFSFASQLIGRVWVQKKGCFPHGVAAGQLQNLPLVRREWKNGSNSSYNCTPFLHSLLTKGKTRVQVLGFRGQGLGFGWLCFKTLFMELGFGVEGICCASGRR